MIDMSPSEPWATISPDSFCAKERADLAKANSTRGVVSTKNPSTKRDMSNDADHPDGLGSGSTGSISDTGEGSGGVEDGVVAHT